MWLVQINDWGFFILCTIKNILITAFMEMVKKR